MFHLLCSIILFQILIFVNSMRYFTEIVLIIIKVAVGQVIIIDFRRIFNRAIAFLQLLMIGLDWQSLDLFPLYLDNNDGNDC